MLTIDKAYDLRTARRTDYYLQSDGGGFYEILEYANGEGYARGTRGGALVRFSQTGRVIRGGMLRCAIFEVIDIGTDELAEGERFGGLMPCGVRRMA